MEAALVRFSPPAPHLRRLAAVLALAVLAAAGPGCGASPVEEEAPSPGIRVLFVGNSLTYWNDLPNVLRSLADSAGERAPHVRTVAVGGYSLEDHWNRGDARREIQRGGWDVVVLQQGPSALEESRVLLREYARRFADEARKVGARPALYMVWPSTDRSGDFDRVSESYALAAADVDGILLPAGEAWRAAWRRDAALPLYSADGLHPGPAGTYAAALAIYGKLYGKSPVGLPARVDLPGGGVLTVPPAMAATLQAAAEEANQTFVNP